MASRNFKRKQALETEAKELTKEAEKFLKIVSKWIKKNYPNLSPTN